MSAYNNLFECIECPIFRIKIDEYVGGIAVRPKPQHCGQLISIIRGFGGAAEELETEIRSINNLQL